MKEEDDPLPLLNTSNSCSSRGGGAANSDLAVPENLNSWRDDTLQSSPMDQEMALQFSRWFYPMFNACNPVCAHVVTTQERFTTDHFFRDSSMRMLSIMGCTNTESIEGAELITERLRGLVRDEGIIFNPNLDPSGVRGSSDPHGRQVVFVCGTVHRGSDVIGLFEQQFGLVRDPLAENNWKIKTTRLALTGTTAGGRIPTLEETKLMLTS